jgi:hypothetical protein
MDCETQVVRHSADDEKDKYVVTLKGSTVVDGDIIDVEVKLTAKNDQLITAWPRGCTSNVKLGPTPQNKLRNQ